MGLSRREERWRQVWEGLGCIMWQESEVRRLGWSGARCAGRGQEAAAYLALARDWKGGPRG